MNKGFTLVEVMIVVGVIGLLASMAIPAYTRSRERSFINRTKSDLRTISGAIDELAFDTGQWPGGAVAGEGADDEIEDLNDGDAGIAANDGTFSGWLGPYMKSVPEDPWGTDYFFDPDYNIGAGQMRVVIGSYGPNGVGNNLYDSDDIYVILD